MRLKERMIGIGLAMVVALGMMTTGVYATDVQVVMVEEEKTYGDQFDEIMNTIMDKYLDRDDISPQDLYDAAMEGMFDALDQYSTYIPSDDSENYTNTLNNTYVGIGVQLIQEGDYVVVTRVFLDGPAEGAGLVVHDKLIAVDGKSIVGFSPQEAANLILGDEGTDVKITVDRSGYVFDVVITRGTVVINAVDILDIGEAAPELSEDMVSSIGYLRIESFTGSVNEELEPALASLKKEGKTHLILDMRDNGGGYVDAAVAVCDLLVPEGPVLRFLNNEGREIVYRSDNLSPDFEIVALVNDNSASATEFVASAIQESGQGVLVGETTYGKGVAQYLYNLEDGAMIKLTQEEFFSGNGQAIHGIGVKPDIRVNVPDYMTLENRYFKGDTHLQIRVAEGILGYLGYDLRYPDSLLDGPSIDVLKQFQTDNNLYPSGILDYTTQEKLNLKLIESVRDEDVQLEKAIETVVQMVKESR